MLTLVKEKFQYENPLKTKFDSEFFRNMSEKPGVYFMFDQLGSILYIGKAKNLRNRVTSYSHARPGHSSDHILEMIENVHSIRWEECKSEQAALQKESELLHAIRPPFNIAQTQAEHYLFLGIKDSDIGRDRVDFKLSSYSEIQDEGYRVFGCYNHRSKVKAGYTALLRLIYASVSEKSRFSFPSKICRVYPPWIYSAEVPADWRNPLERFLSGKSRELLHLIVDQLLMSEVIPAFMRPSIQDDIEIVRAFYQLGPKSTRNLKKRNGIKSSLVTHDLMDRLIEKECKAGLEIRNTLTAPQKTGRVRQLA